MHPQTTLHYTTWIIAHPTDWWSAAYKRLNISPNLTAYLESSDVIAQLDFNNTHGIAIFSDFSALFYKKEDGLCHLYPDPVALSQHYNTLTLYTKDTQSGTRPELRLKNATTDCDWEDERASNLRVAILLSAADAFHKSTFAPMSYYGAPLSDIRPWQDLEAPSPQIFDAQKSAQYLAHLIGIKEDAVVIFPNYSMGKITGFGLNASVAQGHQQLLACLNDKTAFPPETLLFGGNQNPNTLRIRASSNLSLSAHEQLALNALVHKHAPYPDR